MSEKEGGGQVEYEDENPSIHTIFEEECNKHGVTCQMNALSPFCTTTAVAV